MSINRFHATITLGWFAAIIVALGARIVLLATPVSMPESFGWLVVGSVPAYIAWSVFKGAPRTIAEVLYDAENGKTPGTSGPRSESHVARG